LINDANDDSKTSLAYNQTNFLIQTKTPCLGVDSLADNISRMARLEYHTPTCNQVPTTHLSFHRRINTSSVLTNNCNCSLHAATDTSALLDNQAVDTAGQRYDAHGGTEAQLPILSHIKLSLDRCVLCKCVGRPLFDDPNCSDLFKQTSSGDCGVILVSLTPSKAPRPLPSSSWRKQSIG